LRNNSKSGIEQVYKNPNTPENTPKNAKKTTIEWNQKNSKYQNTSEVGARFLHLSWRGAIHTPATRQLCHWSGAFQTCTATSSFDGVTHKNR